METDRNYTHEFCTKCCSHMNSYKHGDYANL